MRDPLTKRELTDAEAKLAAFYQAGKAAYIAAETPKQLLYVLDVLERLKWETEREMEAM